MSLPRCERCRRPLDGRTTGCYGCADTQAAIRLGRVAVEDIPEPERSAAEVDAEIRRVQDAGRKPPVVTGANDLKPGDPPVRGT